MQYANGGKHCEEALDKALEDLNSMLFFGPEIKLQQTHIRLVALNRRTYDTLAEIRNLHQVAAGDVETFILRFAVGHVGPPNPAERAAGVAAVHPSIQEFKVIRSKASASLQLTLILSDGREDGRHWLTNAAIHTLRESGAFDRQFDIHMSPTSDMLMAYRKDTPNTSAVETLPLRVAGDSTDAEWDTVAQQAQAFLNKYRRKAEQGAVAAKPAAPARAPALLPAPRTPPVKASAPPAVQAGQAVGEIKVMINRSGSFMARFCFPKSKEYEHTIALVRDGSLNEWEGKRWISKLPEFRVQKKVVAADTLCVVCIGQEVYDLDEDGRAALEQKLNELVVRREALPQALPEKEPVSGQERKPGGPAAAPGPASPEPVAAPPTAPALPCVAGKTNLTRELFQQAARLPPEGKNAAAFDALELCLGANTGITSRLIEQTYSLLSLRGEEHLGPHFMGFVLTVNLHLAFCHGQMTVRFGLDRTLLENGKSGDTWELPEHAFLGIGGQWEKDMSTMSGFTILVTQPLAKGIPARFRAAFRQSGIAFEESEAFIEKADGSALIWPSSREDTLFYKTALGIREHYRDAAGADIFPIRNDAIKMNPGQVAFTGFKRTARHGIVYQAGDDFFARFEPDETDISAAGYMFAGSAGLIGFALDGSREMCAIYDAAQAKAGFAPPENKLIRFIPVHDVEGLSRQDPRFTCFGLLPGGPCASAGCLTAGSGGTIGASRNGR